MTGHQKTVILDRQTYLTAAYNRLLSKIGPHAKTDLKDIISLCILHVQISEANERTVKELPDDCDC